eukprot:scaffold263232_cov32-Tisochrysis_lutea.AAC.1
MISSRGCLCHSNSKPPCENAMSDSAGHKHPSRTASIPSAVASHSASVVPEASEASVVSPASWLSGAAVATGAGAATNASPKLPG